MKKLISSKLVKMIFIIVLTAIILLSLIFNLVAIFQEKSNLPSLASIFTKDITSWASITESGDRIESAYAFFVGIIWIVVGLILLTLIIIRLIKMLSGKKDLTLAWVITFAILCTVVLIGSAIAYGYSTLFFDNYQARINSF